ncbi:BnaC06g23740D [Brassica napus]|uniref:BnaC06g23740D protein n=1 Tax=Brassica napus TaxID=3708 RepID=A0A078FDQ5_BRANA|nr:BnaC06g23740D [Brassica napus]
MVDLSGKSILKNFGSESLDVIP